jgi:uncharacterized membrane protein
MLILGWIINTPPGVFGKLDAIGYAVCHRIDVRSFHIGNRQLPLCVRCSGQYLGAVFGLIFLSSVGRRRTGAPPRAVIIFLIMFSIVYAIDGLNSYFHLPPMMEMFPKIPRIYEPNNVLRLLTGSGVGLSVAVLLYPTFNRTIWAEYDHRPVIGNLRQLLLGVCLLLLIDLLILTENPFVLYPLSIVSAIGVVFLLSMVYSLVITMIFHIQNRITRYAQLIFPFTAGFFLALLQIAILNAIRYLLTGTWDGFQL